MAANAARLLHELQGTDLELEVKTQAIVDIDGRLGEPEALVAAKEALAATEVRYADLKHRQRSLERETEDIVVRLRSFEQRLYDGSVRSPKELTSIQAEVEMLKAHRRQREDTMLELMVLDEEMEKEFGRLRGEVQTWGEQWLALRGELLHRRQGLEAEIAAFRQARDSLAARIDGPSLALYERLRAAKQGRATATVAQGLCQGCYISLPTSDVRRARLAQELVFCNSCGRILYVT